MMPKIKELKLNLVDDIDKVINKGDALIVTAPEGHKTLIWICPRCGKMTSTARGHKHVFNEETKSLHPSILHAKDLGGCGWHGWLKNGFYNG